MTNMYSDSRLSSIQSATLQYESALSTFLNKCGKYMTTNNLRGEVPVKDNEELSFYKQIKDNNYAKVVEEIKLFIKMNKEE